MGKPGIFRLFGRSITVKISLVILIIETALLGVMGIYYYRSFSNEIDGRLAEKMAIPGALMSQLALNFEAVTDHAAMQELISENVVDAFIFRKGGDIYYSADSARIGRDYTHYIDPEASIGIPEDESDNHIVQYTAENGARYLAIVSPLEVKNTLIGYLYMKIHAEDIDKRKKAIIFIFLVGSLLTIFLTTLFEAFWVHHLFVPRIKRTVSTLQKVKTGEFAARIDRLGSPDQIGSLMHNTNLMIEQVEIYTKNLELLTQAGEKLAASQSMDDIYQIVLETVHRRFNTEAEGVCEATAEQDAGPAPGCREYSRLDLFERKMLAKGEILFTVSDNGKAHLFLPVIENDEVGRIICLVVRPGQELSGNGNEFFVRTLSRLMANAVKKMAALTQVSLAEKKYRDLFSHAAEGIFMSTAEGRLNAVNPSLAKMLGYRSPEHMVSHVHDLGSQVYASVDDRVAILGQIDEKEQIQDVEVQLKHRDGSLFWASLSARAVRNEQGAMIGVEGGVIDASERKMREAAERKRKAAEAAEKVKSELLAVLEEKNEQLVETLEQLQSTHVKLLQAEKMAAIGTMAGGVAHDLNNILSGIVSYPDLLLAQLPKESELRESIGTIKESGIRAAVVVEDLLTLARGVAYNTLIFDVNYLIEKYLKSAEFRQLAHRYPGIRVDSRLDTGLWHAQCSPVHIEKVIMNLSMNAFEAIHASGTVVITTGNRIIDRDDELARSLPSGEYIEMKVTDSGPGIPAQDLPHVFEPFYTKKVLGRSGTGLGLAVVWNTIQEHQGTVTVESGDRGASFAVYLPACRKDPSMMESGDRFTTDLRGKGTVLVVDDEPQLRDIATRMLSTLGYTVDKVSSGEEAVGYLKERAVDMVLLDMLMPPGMNGYETYQEIVRVRPGQKAVITSGYATGENVKRAMEIGVGILLKKPYTLDQLGSAVKNVLEGKA